MKMKKLVLYASSVLMAAGVMAGSSALNVSADNPICQTAFTPDPAPVVFGDRLYVYTGRDRDGNNDFYYMNGYQVMSTTDMQNWTNHGAFIQDGDIKWGKKDSYWASQCIERNGKYYFYVTVENASGGGRAIGVLVGDSPTGPFKDVVGKPIVGPNWDYIDPTVMIDDDGQAYLMFGNPTCYWVKLKEDMITLDGPINKFDMNSNSFGPGKKGCSYGEGPWITKHNDLYYLVYAAFYGNDGGESMGYSTSKSITGPWTYGGQIMKPHNCFTTHGGIIDYKDHSYFFYHKNGLKGGGTFNRSACVEEFTFKSDGSIPLLTMSNEGPKQLEYLNPYKKTEAETICWSEGIKIEKNKSDDGANVSNIQDGSYIKVKGVDFKEGAEKFTVSAGSESDGGAIELHLDKKDGPVIGKCDISGTSGWQNFKEFSTKVSGATDVHDLYLVFRGSSSYLFNLDWWQFSSDKVTVTEPTASPTTAPTVSPSPSVSPDGYIFHDTFESSADSWTARGSASVSKSTSSHYAGSAALSITGRESTWNGATKSLSSSQFKAGSEYAFSACFNAPKADEAVEYKLTLQYDDANGDTQYDKIAQTYGNPGEYVQLYNANYKIPSGASNMQIIAETTEGTMDFFIDEVIAAAAGTKIDGPKSIVRTPTDIKGDVDFDKRITVADLVALKNGILNGFPTKAAKSNADVDKSTEVNAEDAVNLQKYLLGTLTQFPDNTPPEPPKKEYAYNANLQYKAAPDSYFKQPANHGTVVKENYTGINGNKNMYVYLPYGYDKSKKYNVFYLMHGGGESEETCFNDNNINIDIMLDNMIANGDIEPMIVVTPTFNKAPSADGVWEEMRKSIIPYVEGKYSTYAENTNIDGLKASRYHRAYGGFSMGGGSTWANFNNNLDIIAYFMPLSGHCWDGAGKVINAAKNSGFKKNEYFVLAATGTEDIAYGNMVPMINELKKNTDVFTYTADFSKGNLFFLEAKGNVHWWPQVRHYIYDALPYFFHEGQ
ncbi:family 43 glycosylhydrolase [Ruminococcus sp. HUN007]|uniref:family 43 glycosylhydrolase n=1 Tax=Ruminococcus sp. HUN007 TaxID=1514668 RepID=UPI00067959B0|nr:family 43 glycosylhydrolase [Ruminococcus sp. HUN007]